MLTETAKGKDIAYHAAREYPQLYIAYGDTLGDALFAAARRVRLIEKDCIGFDVTVNPPYSYDSDNTWTVQVYAIRRDDDL